VTNPFGEGGFDVNALLQQAQAMQEQLVSAQQRMEEQRFEGTSGPVTVTVTGAGELTDVAIRPGSHDAGDEDSLADLGDYVVAAYRVARGEAEAAQAAANPLAGLSDALGGALGGGEGGLDLGALLGGGAEDAPRRQAGFGLPAAPEDDDDPESDGGPRGV